MITIYILNVDLSNTQNRNPKFQFAEEVTFDEKAAGKKEKDLLPIRLLKSPAILARTLTQRSILKPRVQKQKDSKAKRPLPDREELCDRLKN